MPFSKIHLEQIKIPDGCEDIILNDRELTPELKKLGYDKGTAPIYWREFDVDSRLSIAQNKDNPQTKIEIEYCILFVTSGDSFKKFKDYIKEWAKQNKIKGDTSMQWAYWFIQYIDSDEVIDKLKTDDDLISINVPSGWNNIFIKTPDRALFDRLRIVLSSALKDLSNTKFKEIEQLFEDAVKDASKIEKCTESIDENREEFSNYGDIWNRVEAILKAHGINQQTIPLLAVVCSVPSRTLKKGLEKLSKTFDIKTKLTKDKELGEELFYALQTCVSNYYIDQKTGYATKALVKKTAKMLAQAFNAFGFGIHPNGLVTLIRLFENDVIEGISLESYQADEVYDAEEYGYYDGEENEEFYDEFWSKINIEELIK